MGAGGVSGRCAMTSNFLFAAYLVFAAVLAWDYFAPRLRLKRACHRIVSRARREAAKNPR